MLFENGHMNRRQAIDHLQQLLHMQVRELIVFTFIFLLYVLVCLFRNLAFVFGGTGYPFGHNISNELFILDLNRRHWTRCRLVNQQPEQVYGAVELILIFKFVMFHLLILIRVWL